MFLLCGTNWIFKHNVFASCIHYCISVSVCDYTFLEKLIMFSCLKQIRGFFGLKWTQIKSTGPFYFRFQNGAMFRPNADVMHVMETHKSRYTCYLKSINSSRSKLFNYKTNIHTSNKHSAVACLLSLRTT